VICPDRNDIQSLPSFQIETHTIVMVDDLRPRGKLHGKSASTISLRCRVQGIRGTIGRTSAIFSNSWEDVQGVGEKR